MVFQSSKLTYLILSVKEKIETMSEASTTSSQAVYYNLQEDDESKNSPYVKLVRLFVRLAPQDCLVRSVSWMEYPPSEASSTFVMDHNTTNAMLLVIKFNWVREESGYKNEIYTINNVIRKRDQEA